MQLGTLEYLISIKDNNIDSELKKSETKVKNWGDKLSSWTVAKGQMIARFGEKAVSTTANVMKSTIKGAVDAFGQYEQLADGAKLLFGKGFDYIMDKAEHAFSNVQISMNEYLEQANAYATGLKTSLNGDAEAAAVLADRIITAQSDVVAATGASREAVENAFKGLLRGNFTMLDNLQLGIKGTQAGMAEVIKSVNDWHKANKRATQYQMGNLADMNNALIDYIEMQGMAGYANAEAMDTLQGSISATKAAWKDLLTNIGRGQDIKKSAKNFADIAKKTLSNLKPVVVESVKGIFTTIKELLPEVGSIIKEIFADMRNSGNPFFEFIGNAFEKVRLSFVGLHALITDFPGTIESMKLSDNTFLNILAGVLETIQGLFNWFVDNKDIVISAVSGIVAAFSVSKIAGFLMNLNPVTAVIGLIAAAATLVVSNWESVKTTVIGIWESITEAVSGAWEEVSKWFSDVRSDIAQVWGAIATWFDTTVWQPLMEFFQPVWDVISQLWSGIKELISPVWSAIATWFNTTVWEPLKAFFQPVWDFISNLWTGIKDKLVEAWGAVEAALSPIIEPIKALFKGVTDSVLAIVEAIESAIAWINQLLGFDGKYVNIKSTITKEVVDVHTTADGTTTTTYDDGSSTTQSSGGVSGGRGFAKGNWYVPYDNYPSLLHRGEMVLTKSQARQYRDGEASTGVGGNIGREIRDALGKINVLMSGEKVGDLTTKRVKRNINASSYSRLRAMGG